MTLSLWRLLAVALVLQLASQALEGQKAFDPIALQKAGISTSAVEQLRALRLDGEEVEQAAAVKQAGMAEENIVTLWRTYHRRGQRFVNGKAVVRLRNVGTSDETILELARRDLLDGWVADVVAMRRAGFSDGGILELSDLKLLQKRPIPPGDTLARLKRTGLSEEAIIRLAAIGLRAEDIDRIEQLRRKGTDEKEIIRTFERKPH